MANFRDGLKPYWVNTAHHALIEKLLTLGGITLKPELEDLIQGKTIEKKIEESIVFSDLEKNDQLLWSFLLFSGYLKTSKKNANHVRDQYELSIPNEEVKTLYKSLIEKWFHQRLPSDGMQQLLNALIQGKIDFFEKQLQDLVLKVFSFHDFSHEPERVYQAFIIGLLVFLEDQYEVKSNRESGTGRYDLILIPVEKDRLGFVLEFKKLDTNGKETLQKAFQKAFLQMEEKKYSNELKQKGITTIKKLAIIFQGKKVWVREAE